MQKKKLQDEAKSKSINWSKLNEIYKTFEWQNHFVIIMNSNPRTVSIKNLLTMKNTFFQKQNSSEENWDGDVRVSYQ